MEEADPHLASRETKSASPSAKSVKRSDKSSEKNVILPGDVQDDGDGDGDAAPEIKSPATPHPQGISCGPISSHTN